MALVLTDFKHGDTTGTAPGIHAYTTIDTLATVNASGYFNNLSATLSVGDKIYCAVDTDGIPSYVDLNVISNASGTVDVDPETAPRLSAISGSGATVTLTKEQSGSVFLFDRAAGIVVTLPAPLVGLEFDFVVSVDLTAAAYQVDTDAATTFIVGGLQGAIEAAATDETHFANGTTHIGVSMNKTTTGGLIGGAFKMKCISPTLWLITGNTSCTATPATPFTT